MRNEEKLVKKLADKNWKIAAAESVTGGLFASSVISAPGASNVIGASFVTYSDEAKVRFAGVSQDTLSTYGAVSEQVAGEMAAGAAALAGAHVGVGITGFADGANGGLVCFGFSVCGFVSAVKIKFDGDRNSVRKSAAAFAVNTLIDQL